MPRRSKTNKKYSAELKLKAVQDYLNGVGSQVEICKRYGISSHTTLQDWIIWYNGHREFKGRSSAKGETYNVSYQQVYSWVHKYEEKGVEGLADRRGKAKPKNELTEADRLRQENKGNAD